MRMLLYPYRILLWGLVPVLWLSACSVNDNLLGCSTESLRSNVLLAPTYTKHATGNASQDLFGSYARRVDVYLFDENEKFVTRYADASSLFANGYRRRLDNLSAGRYKAVMWVNDLEETVLSEDPKPGMTLLADLTLRLRQLESLRVTDRLNPLLWGTTAFFDVMEEREGEQVIPVDLTLDTNIIQVLVTWRDEETGKPCPSDENAKSTHVYLEDDNGILGFDNSKRECPWLTYIPEYLRVDSLPVAGGAGSLPLKAEFRTLRLFVGSSTKLLLKKAWADGSETQLFKHNLMDYIRDRYDTQDALDRQERFLIELELDCAPPSLEEGWIALTVKVNGWVVVKNGNIGV